MFFDIWMDKEKVIYILNEIYCLVWKKRVLLFIVFWINFLKFLLGNICYIYDCKYGKLFYICNMKYWNLEIEVERVSWGLDYLKI